MVAQLLTAACLALQVTLWYYVLRYNLHMFQQNMYVPGEQLAWLRGAWLRQDVLLVCLATAMLATGAGMGAPAVPHLLVVAFATYYFHFLKTHLAKKPLVFTARVRRLMATDALAAIGVTAVTGVTLGLGAALVALAVLTAAQPLALLVANAANAPVERAINNHYLNDARRLLAASPRLAVIGVTGSYGKTSVKHYLHTLLRDSFEVLVTPGNYNTPLGITRTVRADLRPTHEVFICEMGARYVGEIAEICELVHPSHGVICAVGPQHLETFGSIDNVEVTKFELAEALPAGGLLFLNVDNERIRSRASRYPAAITYGTGADGSYRAEDVALTSGGTSFTLVTPSGRRERFEVRLVGTHAIVNVVGALAVAHELGVPLARLKVPARRIRAASHRMEVTDAGWATLVDDAYNSNPVGARAAVETLAGFDGMRILITPGMVELGDEQARYNRELGVRAATCCDWALVVGKENRDALVTGLAEGGMAPSRMRTFARVEDALAFARGIDADGRKYVLIENDLPDIY